MNWLSERTDRRRSARASVVLGWAFALVVLMSCCWPASGSSASSHDRHASATAPAGITLAVAVPAVPVVVADAPGRRGTGSSCHGASEHSAPVVLPTQPAPAALPSAAAPLASAPLTGAVAIRGPSDEAVDDVDHLRLQVQRI